MTSVGPSDKTSPAIHSDICKNTASILLIDDEKEILNSHKIILEERGFQIAMAETGKDALLRLNNAHFHVVLLDIGLPDCCGLELIETILAPDIGTKVIVVSGQSDIEMALSAIKLGAHDYLRKPYPVLDLVKSVNNALRQLSLEFENRQMSRKLQSAEKMYRHLVDNSPDLVFTVNPEGCFTFVNRRSETLLGFEPEILIGCHFSTIIDLDDIDRARNVFRERRVGDRASSDVELRLKRRYVAGTEKNERDSYLIVSCSAFGMYEGKETDNALNYAGAYGVARDITERKRSDEVLSFRAYHDLLTGLPNRALLHDRFDVAAKRAARTRTCVGVLFVDLDGFKRVNDLFGHKNGDLILQEVAKRLQNCLRKADTLARLGGDEFVVLLPDLHALEHASIIADKCLHSLRDTFFIDGRETFISGSIGIAGYPTDGQSCDKLLECADKAMYQAKTLGKNAIAFFC